MLYTRRYVPSCERQDWSRDSWFETAVGPPRYRGGTRCSTTITALTVRRRGAYREVSRHGDHIGLDLHTRNTQLSNKAEDGTIMDRRIVASRERYSAVLGGTRRCSAVLGDRLRARILLRASYGERVGGAPPGGARSRGDRGRPEFRADVCPRTGLTMLVASSFVYCLAVPWCPMQIAAPLLRTLAAGVSGVQDGLSYYPVYSSVYSLSPWVLS